MLVGTTKVPPTQAPAAADRTTAPVPRFSMSASSAVAVDEAVVSGAGAGAGAGAGDAGAVTRTLPHAGVTIGFVGVGTMASAIVRGLCTAPAVSPKAVVLSPRGKAKVAALVASFGADAGGIVSVAADNQAVVDEADWVVLGVLPKQAEAVYGPLTFREGQVVINLLATSDNAHIAGLVAPAGPVIRAVPLPPVAVHACPTLMCPDHAGVRGLFEQLGGASVVDEDAQRQALQAVPCMMGPYYQTLVTITLWLGKKGIPLSVSGPYTAQLFQAITLDAVHAGPAGFQGLVDEQTPGGLNEGAIRQLREAGVFDTYHATLDRVLERSTGGDRKKEAAAKAASDDA